MAADVVVSLANCKTHNLAGYTGACKNLFGCLPQMDKTLYHSRLHDVVHDVNLAISPQLGIVDGFAAMGGNGPISGQARDLGFRVFSRSAIGADMVASQLAGMDPSRIPHLRQLAATLGVEVNLGDSVGLQAQADQTYRKAFWMTVRERRRSTEHRDYQQTLDREVRALAREIWRASKDLDLRLRVLAYAVAPELVDALARWHGNEPAVARPDTRNAADSGTRRGNR